MEKILRGKYLVRRATLEETGQKVLIITGIFHPQNFDVDDVKSNDEMWVSDLIVAPGGIRFSDPLGSDGGSPEDFLNGDAQSPRSWKTRESL